MRPLGESKLRYAVYVFAVPVLLLSALALTGCTSKSPGIPSIYIFSFSHGQDDFAVRMGYFGICVGPAATPTCGISAGRSIEDLHRDFSGGSSKFLDVVLPVATALQSQVLPASLAPTGILFLLGALCFAAIRASAHHEVDAMSRARTVLRFLTLIALGLAVAFGLASSLSIAQTAAALQLMTGSLSGAITVTSGTTLQAIQWAAFAFCVVFTVGASTMLSGQAEY